MIERVPIAEFATEVSRPVALDPGVAYKSVGVKWYGAGVHVHEVREGHLFEADRFQIQTNDIIYNDMWARMGSVAIVPTALSGAVASSHFPTFHVDQSRALPAYLSWYFRSPPFWDDCELASRGSTGRNQIKRKTFLSIEIPLPTLNEQRRMVARIEELSAKVEEAQRLRTEAERYSQMLLRSIVRHDNNRQKVRVRDIATLRTPDVLVMPNEEYQFAGVYTFGRGVFRSVRKMGSEFSYPRLTRLRTGDFVYPKLMAWEGALGVVPPECEGMVVSTEFPVFELNQEIVAPIVLDVYFRSPEIWPSLSGQSGGTNVRRRRLNPQDFLDLEVPLPSKLTQRLLIDVGNRLHVINRLRRETAIELDAMLPAILDKAFKGEL